MGLYLEYATALPYTGGELVYVSYLTYSYRKLSLSEKPCHLTNRCIVARNHFPLPHCET